VCVISCLVAVHGYLARLDGVDIELLRRSSFGFLEPNVVAMSDSIRISPGLLNCSPSESDLLTLSMSHVTSMLVIRKDKSGQHVNSGTGLRKCYGRVCKIMDSRRTGKNFPIHRSCIVDSYPVGDASHGGRLPTCHLMHLYD